MGVLVMFICSGGDSKYRKIVWLEGNIVASFAKNHLVAIFLSFKLSFSRTKKVSVASIFAG